MGLLFAVVAIAAVAVLSSSSTPPKPKPASAKTPPATATGSGPQPTALVAGNGERWTPISPFVPPGQTMALATAMSLGLKLLTPGAFSTSAAGLLGSEIFLVLQGNQKTADQIALPLVAVSGKVTGVTSSSGGAGVQDAVVVAVDTIIDLNSDAAKLPKAALPGTGSILVPAALVASTGS